MRRWGTFFKKMNNIMTSRNNGMMSRKLEQRKAIERGR